MAKAALHPLLTRLNGQLGEIVFKQYGEKVVVARKPVFDNPQWSAAQKAGRERFRRAAQYAKAALTGAAQERYRAAARATGRPAYRLALADYLNPPRVEAVSGAGAEIVVWAADDFGVARLLVRVYLPDGSLHEEGEAQPDPGAAGRWVYRLAAPVAAGSGARVKALAFDLAGNSGEVEGRAG